MVMRTLLRLVIGSMAGLLLPFAASAETVGTLTLDSLSYVSFQDEQVLPLPAGSTLRFRFGDPQPDGSVSFTLAPADVAIDPLPLSDGRTLRYGLAAPANGVMETTPTGRKITFNASVSATLSGEDGGTFTYTVPFSTESAAASNAARTRTVEVDGMRVVDGARYVQIVGATVNRTNAFPKPGAAVYTVLSGQFDQVP